MRIFFAGSRDPISPFRSFMMHAGLLLTTGGAVWHPWKEWSHPTLPHRRDGKWSRIISHHRRDRKWCRTISRHRRGRRQSVSLLGQRKAGRPWNMSSRASSVLCACLRIFRWLSPWNSGEFPKRICFAEDTGRFSTCRDLPGRSYKKICCSWKIRKKKVRIG